MNNRIIKTILFVLIFFIFTQPASAAEVSLAKKMSGKFLLQVQSYGRIWYVYPKTNQRYYLKSGAMALDTLKSLSLSLAPIDLQKIPIKQGDKADTKMVNRLKGYVLRPTNQEDIFWYVNPANGLRYSFTNSQELAKILSQCSLGIKDIQLRKIPMNSEQLVFDTTFNDVAYVRYDGITFDKKYNADKILPPASMTKLMTALVLLDQNFDFSKKIIINENEINYPGIYSGGDKTSEINFAVGDQMTGQDLFVAMLVSSSNQAAITLADATGLGRQEFVEKMNQKAKDLGLKKTIFYDVSGLDPHNVTTPKEMALIASAAFAQSKIADTTITQKYQIKALDINDNLKNIAVINRNQSLLQYNPDGVKTGFLVEAQRTVSLKKGNNIIVVMHAMSLGQKNKIIKSLIN
ncbi:MAG: serine hydrolase [Candidatus Buchananbacteria bacterium]